MLPDRISNSGPLTYDSGALPTTVHNPCINVQVMVWTSLIYDHFDPSDLDLQPT